MLAVSSAADFEKRLLSSHYFDEEVPFSTLRCCLKFILANSFSVEQPESEYKLVAEFKMHRTAPVAGRRALCVGVHYPNYNSISNFGVIFEGHP